MEVDCKDFKIGPFGAHDFYGDGSLYLLDTPGHWPGHLAALARTTPDTFLFLGGDMCHFAGHFRPSKHVPLPDTIPEEAFRGHQRKYPAPCPCAFFSDHHPQLQSTEEGDTAKEETVDVRTTPFYKLSTHKISSYKDPAQAAITTDEMREYFDSDPNVLVCLAHDTALIYFLPTFNSEPEKDLNDWKNQGMKEKIHWGWLGELPRYDKDGNVVGPGLREVPIIDGHWKDGKLITSFDGLS